MSERAYILSVDDQLMNQEIIRDLLEDDYDVAFASNGSSCIQSVEKRRPDLILLDINMPQINGLDICKSLRQNKLYDSVRIIFVSALASSKEVDIGIQTGADDYLTKPFSIIELKDKIAYWLNKVD
jgi:CheY-like chemotaxis protein